MKIAIIGSGFTGLTAAYWLAKKNHLVQVFEKENLLGGLGSSFKEDSWNWPVERYYHHFFTSDKEAISLIEKLNLKDKFFFHRPKTSLFFQGRIYRFDDPQSVLAFPKLNWLDKGRLGVMTILLKLNPFWQPLEKVSAASFIQKTMGSRSFALIWQPLLQNKFGQYAFQIPASWFWTRLKKRSFSLGYLAGGLQGLTDCLEKEIKLRQGKIFLKQEVTQIKKDGEKFAVFLADKKHQEKFDRVIVSTSPAIFQKICPQLSEKEKENLRHLKSLGSLCLVLFLKQSFLTEGTYWLNINEKDFPFVAVVEHTNLIDKKYYGGNTILYVGGYYPENHPFFKMTKEQIFKEFQPFLEKINPDFDFSLSTVSCFLSKDPYAQPIPAINYSQTTLPSLKTSLPGLYWGSLHHVYPEDRGINYAIKLGKEIADEILKKG